MKGRIFRSIALGALGILLVCFGVFLGVLYDYFTGVEEAQLRTSLVLAANGVEKSGRAYLDGLKDKCRLTWVAADGTVLFDSERNAADMDNHALRDEIKHAFSSGEGTSARYSDTLTEKTLYHALRLSDGTVLRISVSSASILLLVLGMLHPLILMLLISLALLLLLSHRLTGKIMQPLTDMDLEKLPSKPPYEELEPFFHKIRSQQGEIARQKQALSDKRLNMEFAEQNRREFTANVSHELKTPLQGIMGGAELIESGLVQAEDLPQFAGRIRREATRMLALIEDIIHLSHLDEGSRMDSSPLDLYAFAQEEVQAMQVAARDQQVQLTLLGESATIDAVPQLVRDILHNLLDNAIKYNRPGGRAIVRVTRDADRAILSVSDSGIGIPQEQQSRVFERFYRVDKSHSKTKNGTGLGLSIVKNAAAYLRAEIALESASGVGTTISVKFPLARDFASI